MDTRISLVENTNLSSLNAVNALVIPTNTMLDLRITKLGKEVLKEERGVLDQKVVNFRRNYIATTGCITYPSKTTILMTPEKVHVDLIILAVLPDLMKGDTKEVKVKNLYDMYKNVLSVALVNNCKRIVTPVLGSSNKVIDDKLLALSLITALSDFTKETTYFKEISIAPKDKNEFHTIHGWFKDVSKTFGLDLWYTRNSLDLKGKDISIQL